MHERSPTQPQPPPPASATCSGPHSQCTTARRGAWHCPMLGADRLGGLDAPPYTIIPLPTIIPPHPLHNTHPNWLTWSVPLVLVLASVCLVVSVRCVCVWAGGCVWVYICQCKAREARRRARPRHHHFLPSPLHSHSSLPKYTHNIPTEQHHAGRNAAADFSPAQAV